jgi:hypothetical protein
MSGNSSSRLSSRSSAARASSFVGSFGIRGIVGGDTSSSPVAGSKPGSSKSDPSGRIVGVEMTPAMVGNGQQPARDRMVAAIVTGA